jgi:protein-serine/threonine kinase
LKQSDRSRCRLTRPTTSRAHDTSYYDQQRQGLLKRHGIDLEEPSGSTPKKMDRKKVEELMGGEQGLLTWRDKNRRKMAFSVAGTNSYMAVEVIRGTGYQFSCDWWSAGVMLVPLVFLLEVTKRLTVRLTLLQHV